MAEWIEDVKYEVIQNFEALNDAKYKEAIDMKCQPKMFAEGDLMMMHLQVEIE